MNDRFVAKRNRNIVWMLLATLITNVVISLAQDRFWDEIVVYLLMDLVFFALFFFVLEYERMHKRLSANRETTYRKIFYGYLLSCGTVILSSFLPEFLKPMLLIPLLMAAYGTQGIAMYTGIFLNALMCLALGSGTQELILYCLMTLFGCMLVDAVTAETLRKWSLLSIFCVSAILPGLFYYLTYRETKMSLFFFGAAEGLVIAVLVRLYYRRILAAKQTEIIDTMEDMLDESYPMSRELSGFSKADYQHARRVSRVAARCAGLVNADEKLCAAAGFYYRIGILEGESIVTSGIKIAQRECFPEAVIRIISEYNGERELPSTIESAIVHMVDGLIKKLEVFDADTMSSEWNQDMVIYQTLNDYSTRGLYDKSGLSMNMFLKIREYLVNEEALL